CAPSRATVSIAPARSPPWANTASIWSRSTSVGDTRFGTGVVLPLQELVFLSGTYARSTFTPPARRDQGLLHMPQLVVGRDHLLRGQVEPVGDVALYAGHRPRFGLQLAVEGAFAAGELDEPVPFDCRLAIDRGLRLCHLLVDAAQGSPGPIGAVLVVDDVIPSAVFRPGRPRLDEDAPVVDLLAGMLLAPLVDHVRRLGDLLADDERQAFGLDRFAVRVRDHP